MALAHPVTRQRVVRTRSRILLAIALIAGLAPGAEAATGLQAVVVASDGAGGQSYSLTLQALALMMMGPVGVAPCTRKLRAR